MLNLAKSWNLISPDPLTYTYMYCIYRWCCGESWWECPLHCSSQNLLPPAEQDNGHRYMHMNRQLYACNVTYMYMYKHTQNLLYKLSTYTVHHANTCIYTHTHTYTPGRAVSAGSLRSEYRGSSSPVPGGARGER